MTTQPRRIWSGIVLPAGLHAAVTARVGPRGLTAAVTTAVDDLVRLGRMPKAERPCRGNGTVEITLRLPVRTADAAEAWRLTHGLSRQATVEYALMAALDSI